MPFNASEFRKQLTYGGARPNQFDIVLSNPPSAFTTGYTDVLNTYKMMANAADMPGSIIGTIPVPYFGRFINVAGDRMFEDWTCAIYCDEDFKLRNAFESWNNSMAFINYDTNKEHGKQAELINSYVCDVQIRHYTKTGNIDKIYKLHNAFPYVVSPVQLSWQANDQIMMFEVTWKYDYFTTTFTPYSGQGKTDSSPDTDTSAKSV